MIIIEKEIFGLSSIMIRKKGCAGATTMKPETRDVDDEALILSTRF